jgi:hypothetical protein
MTSSMPSQRRTRHVRRINPQSVFYARIVPLILLLFALVTMGIVVFALGVLVGLISFR